MTRLNALLLSAALFSSIASCVATDDDLTQGDDPIAADENAITSAQATDENATATGENVTIAGRPNTGTVRWFDPNKGFGFINPDRNDWGDIYVYWRDIEGCGFHTLDEGDRVEFQVGESSKGPRATNVRNLTDCYPRGPRR